MSQIFETQAPTPSEPVNRFSTPIRYGLMLGFISMFLTTIMFLYVLKMSFVAFGITGFLTFVISLFFYYITAKRQKDDSGGTIILKDAFQAIFIVILISLFISTIYGLIYNKYIDPECSIRMKEQAFAFFEKLKMPPAELDKQMAKIDAQIQESTKPSTLLYSVAQSLIISSIFGFIIALIVSRKTPIPQQ